MPTVVSPVEFVPLKILQGLFLIWIWYRAWSWLSKRWF